MNLQTPRRDQSGNARANPFGAPVFIGCAALGAVAYLGADLLAPDFRNSNLWFGYAFLAPILGFFCGALVHLFARDQELYGVAGFGFGVGNLLASGARVIPSAGMSVAGNLLVIAAIAGAAFGFGWAFAPAAVALARTILGWDEAERENQRAQK
jgi:hypothetical protein